MGFTLVNNVTATVATQSNSGTTSLVVGTGLGAQFASATTTNPIRCGAFDSTGALKFFFDVTARSTDTLTVANRGAESTTDANILTTDVVAAVATVAALQSLSSSPLIAETILAATASSISFSSIPGSYRALRLSLIGRSSTTEGDAVLMRFNSDSTTTYDYQRMTGQGSSSSSTALAATTAVSSLWIAGAGGGNASAAGTVIVDIPYYARTDFHKTGIARAGQADSTAANDTLAEVAFTWHNTTAITTITLSLNSGASFAIGTAAALYGVT